MHLTISDIRNEFVRKFEAREYVSVAREKEMTNLVGSRTIEIIGSTFIADEGAIFGKPNYDYIKREEEWYHSQSLNVNDIPGGPPQIWKTVADSAGFINSNYGWTCFSEANGSQYAHVLAELKNKPDSRRAVMIYTRPSMWEDYNVDGRNDFMCTNTVQYLIRDKQLNAVVNMRSQDSIFGYKNDRHFQHQVQKRLAQELDVEVGKLIWQTGSIHVYERHFYLIDHFMKTGEIAILKEEYDKKYFVKNPDSPLK